MSVRSTEWGLRCALFCWSLPKKQKPYRWCDSKRARSSVVGRALETPSGQTKDKIGIDCFSAKQGVLRWKNKD